MNRSIVRYVSLLAASGLLLPLATGCKTIVRETIISTINTGIGVTVAQNPQTQSYEVKLGYIRSQFYSVPTGKTVEKAEGAPDSQYANAAGTTPQLVSGIKMDSSWKNLFLGVEVSENFAVGDVAVMSPAAVAMYISMAENTNNAEAAARAVQSTSAFAKLGRDGGLTTIKTVNGIRDFLVGLPAGDYPQAKERLRGLDEAAELVPDQYDFDSYEWAEDRTQLAVQSAGSDVPESGYQKFKNYRDTLAQSAQVLREASNLEPRSFQELKVVRDEGDPAAMDVEVSRHLGMQKSWQEVRLAELDRAFAQHPAVQAALDYFTHIVQP